MVHPLEKWILENGLTKAEFARQANLQRQAVFRYCNYLRLPNLDAIKKIHDATNGEITFKDFMRKETYE
jgi:predicted transcriptional regulator